MNQCDRSGKIGQPIPSVGKRTIFGNASLENTPWRLEDAPFLILKLNVVIRKKTTTTTEKKNKKNNRKGLRKTSLQIFFQRNNQPQKIDSQEI